ncbi:MAG: class I SAM-dependent methyltransferase [Proteobacteria bacterium]|nr:class I SAM-dependent methyltransferase [Pseudomonadota bacterium]
MHENAKTPGMARPVSARARAYGAQNYPRIIQDAVVAVRMARGQGIGATLRHARTVALARVHFRVIDKNLQRQFPHTVLGETPLDGLALSGARQDEAVDATPYSPVPSKTFHWAIGGLPIDHRQFAFIDIGSGRGYALHLARAYPFRRLIGVEFARELHLQARDNLAANATRDAPQVELRHESALETALPPGPTLFYLFSPFGGKVMRAFIERIEQSLIADPRPVIVVYVNPIHDRLFARPGVAAIAPARRQRRLLRWLSPFDARIHAWTHTRAVATSDTARHR